MLMMVNYLINDNNNNYGYMYSQRIEQRTEQRPPSHMTVSDCICSSLLCDVQYSLCSSIIQYSQSSGATQPT